MDTDSFIAYIKTFIKILQEMLKQDLAYESNKPLSKKKA